MSGSEDETYSTIFASLKHPARRKILRMLSEKPKTFSEMLETLGISSSHLTYHLESLGELVSKPRDGKYKLSAFGEAAVTTMSKVEEAPRTTELKHLQSLPMKWKSVLAVLMISLVILAGISIIQFRSLNRISAEHEKLTELLDLVEKGTSIRREYTIRHKVSIFQLDEGYPVHASFSLPSCVIYNPYDNSTLYLSLSISTPLSNVSINLQEGNAFNLRTNETAVVIWRANTTMNNIYHVPLNSKGWYTISLFGPMVKLIDDTGKATGLSFFLPREVNCWMDIRLVYEASYSPFLVKFGRD